MRATPSPKPEAIDCNRVSAHNASRFRDKLALALKASMDADRAKRLEALECQWCFYMAGARWAGQAFTAWNCAECGVEDQASSTATPKLCAACARDLELCRECCADLDLRCRRKLRNVRRGDRIFAKSRRKNESGGAQP